MALNLDSLKNLSTFPPSAPEKTGTLWVSELSKESDAHDTGTKMAPVSISPVEKTSAMRPRLSLIKLKQASSGDTTEVIAEPEAPLSDDLSVAEIEKWFTSSIAKPEEVVAVEEANQEEISTVPETVTVLQEIENVPSIQKEDSLESQSIVIDNGENDIHEAQEVVAEPKELFPNFRIANTVQLDDDLLDFQDIITSDTLEASGEVSNAEPVNVIPEVPVLVIEESVVKDEQEIVVQSAIEEDAAWEDTIPAEVAHTETIDVTPEYVAEVKTELSEGRRAGFRFLMQKKTKIIAGLTIVFSLSFIAMISGWLFQGDVSTTGKTNVQETNNVQKTNNVPPLVDTTATGSQELPGAEPANYEVGRDYSVTKNTKKNVRSKAVITTLSGSETPTP